MKTGSTSRLRRTPLATDSTQATLGHVVNASAVTALRPGNRLSREKSPYLLQHQHNPVDWFPWGDEAFARARERDRPIFLSIGYATCHWCHVMERETFEDTAVADFLNHHFVSIKIDREERPDIDQIHMTFVQATTGQGGWPLNVFLTPDLRPFFGGTYFPPTDRPGRPGFLSLLTQIQQLWNQRRADLIQSAAELQARLETATQPPPLSDPPLSADALAQAAHCFQEEYDRAHGGFGTAPKFPRPSQPAFLLRHGARTGDREVVRMVLHTCDRMAAGGIHDQLGGGFHRYSVDAEWLVPHFEKMLYDNAQLANLYLDAFLVSGQNRYADVARGIFRYVLRDLRHPEGGFYSAEDADSEGQEGRFYCWTVPELADALSPDELAVVLRHFGVTAEGNFVDHSHPNPLAGLNVLHAAEAEVRAEERPLLDRACARLLDARATRQRPFCDDKVLASWNGMMLGALARGYAVLGEGTYRQAAEQNLRFLQRQLWDPALQQLHHRWREGECDRVQLLADYAFVLAGTLDLYEATLDPELVSFALALANSLLKRFHDPQHGGFFQSTATPDLTLRLKEDYDGAEPSGNSIASMSLLRLAAITGNLEFHEAAVRTLQTFAHRLRHLPQAVPQMLQALDFLLEEPLRVVVTGDPQSAEVRNLLRAVHTVFQPNKVVLGTAGPVEETARRLAGHPPSVHLCTATTCRPPTTDMDEIRRALAHAVEH